MGQQETKHILMTKREMVKSCSKMTASILEQDLTMSMLESEGVCLTVNRNLEMLQFHVIRSLTGDNENSSPFYVLLKISAFTHMNI